MAEKTRRCASAVVAMVLATATLVACASEPTVGAFQAVGLGAEPVVLNASFSEAFYGDVLPAETTLVLADVDADELLDGRVDEGQIVHIELLWVPKPGSTPLDSTATNATIRYVVIAGGEVGVYEGGGFIRPEGDVLGASSTKILVLDSMLRLAEHTPGFVDLLSPARLRGTVTASRDDRATRRLYFAVSQYVTDQLGRSVFVRRDRGGLSP